MAALFSLPKTSPLRHARRRSAGWIETLEQRVAPAAVTTHWVGGSGNWTDGAHWDNGVPNNDDGSGNSYTAVLNVAATPTITINSSIHVTALDNAEAVALSGNGYLLLGEAQDAAGSALNNAGSITVGGTSLFTVSADVGGLTTAKLGEVHVSGGAFRLETTLTNIGATLTVDAPSGVWKLAGGSIIGGTIQSDNGAALIATNAGGTLDGVTMNADLDLSGGAELTIVTIVNGLTLNGVARLGNYGILEFAGTQTLDGTGSIVVLESVASGMIQSGTNPVLTIGSGITVHGGSTQYSGGNTGDSDYLGNIAGGTIINEGKFSADVANAHLYFIRSTVVNHGTIEAKDGGRLFIENLSTNSGTLSAAGGGMLEIAGDHWTNTGTLSENAGELALSGKFTVAGLGTLTLNGAGNVLITGTLENAGTTLTLDPAATWFLHGGTIQGGTVQSSGGSKLFLMEFGGTLDGVTLNADLDVTRFNVGAGAIIRHGLTLNGQATMGGNSYLSFAGSQTLDGTGSVFFEDSANSRLSLLDQGTTLTIGPAITIHGGSAQSHGTRIGYGDTFNSPTDVTVVNYGKISADVSGTSLNILQGRFINAGIAEAINGGTLNAPTLIATEKAVLTKTSAPYAFHDADGTPVSVKWLGAGSVTLVRFSNATTSLGDLYSITTTGSNLSSTLSITTTGTAGTTSVETIEIHGGLKSLTAPKTDLVGDATSTNSIGALTLGKVVNGSTIKLGPRATGDTKTATSLTFDIVGNLQIDSSTPLLALTAVQWLDQDNTPDVIAAPSLGTLTIKAPASRGLSADFQADLKLSGAGVLPKALTLGKATVGGKIGGSDWKVTGNVGTITAGSTGTDWSTHFSGRLTALTITGNASGAIFIGARPTGDLTSRTTLNFDTISELSIHSMTPIGTFTTRNWIDRDGTADLLEAPALSSLKVNGDTRLSRPLPGDFEAGLTLNGTGVAATAATLGSVTVKGKVADATWTVTGNTGAISVGSTGLNWDATITKNVLSLNATGTVRGSFHAGMVGSVKANVIETFDLRSDGNIGSVSALKLLGSRIYAGVQSAVTGLPQSNADFATVATIAKLTIFGPPGLNPAIAGSYVAASKITTATIGGFVPFAGGVQYGLAADSIASLTVKTGNTTVTQTKLNAPSLDATASGDDFFVRIL